MSLDCDVVRQWLWSELEKYGELPEVRNDQWQPLASGVLDSINVLKFIVRIQQHFKIALDLQLLVDGSLQTVGDFVEYICNSKRV